MVMGFRKMQEEKIKNWVEKEEISIKIGIYAFKGFFFGGGVGRNGL